MSEVPFLVACGDHAHDRSTERSRELICYTAVLGGYDDLPTMRQGCPAVRNVCFTDTPAAFAGQDTWTIVEVAPFFQDRKLATGYLKTLSHRLFGNDAVSLWVDASLRDVDLAEAFATEATVALPPHQLRNTVAEEAREVVKHRLEHAATAARHLAFLCDQEFPDDVGLSATMFLIRDHRDPRLRRANEIWWEIISGGVRRDQLTFDYALWAVGLKPLHLDVDWWKPNRLFTMGPHRSPAGRQLPDSRLERPRYSTELQFPSMPPAYPCNVSYVPEQVTAFESYAHRQLNAVVAAHSPEGVVEGDYCHFDQSRVSEFSPPDPRRSWKREYLRRSVRGHRKALEIGFNAGHSAAIMLCAQPDLVLHSIDIAEHPYTRPCAERLQALFGERFAFTVGDSKLLLPSMELADYDFIHVDGGHDADCVRSDLEAFFEAGAPGTLLMVDDAYVPHIAGMLADALQAGRIEPASPGFASSGENRLFRKPDPWQQLRNDVPVPAVARRIDEALEPSILGATCTTVGLAPPGPKKRFARAWTAARRYRRFIWNKMRGKPPPAERVSEDPVEGSRAADVRSSFICGCGHSGTSLLANILAGHPFVFAPLRETATFLRPPGEAERLYQALLDEAKSSSKQWLIEKTPMHVRHLDTIRSIATGARFILMVRDGRDVAASHIKRFGNHVVGIRRWIADNTIVFEQAGKEDVLIVRYEDLIAFPPRTVETVCAYIGLPFSVSLLDYHRTPRLWFGETEIRKGDGSDGGEHIALRNWQINQPIFDGRGKWRELLSEDDVRELTEGQGAALMRSFGYI